MSYIAFAAVIAATVCSGWLRLPCTAWTVVLMAQHARLVSQQCDEHRGVQVYVWCKLGYRRFIRGLDRNITVYEEFCSVRRMWEPVSRSWQTRSHACNISVQFCSLRQLHVITLPNGETWAASRHWYGTGRNTYCLSLRVARDELPHWARLRRCYSSSDDWRN